MPIDKLIQHRYKCSFYIIVSYILHTAGGLILQMGVAGPCDILVSSAGMNPSLKGVTTFSADYLSWKSISLLVFVTAFFDTFLKGTLWYKRICCLKVCVADNCFMMIRCHVLINFTIICVAIEVFIRVCFLKDDITCIFSLARMPRIVLEVQLVFFLDGIFSAFSSSAIALVLFRKEYPQIFFSQPLLALD